MHTVIVYGQSLINAYRTKLYQSQMHIQTKLNQIKCLYGQSYIKAYTDTDKVKSKSNAYTDKVKSKSKHIRTRTKLNQSIYGQS